MAVTMPPTPSPVDDLESTEAPLKLQILSVYFPHSSYHQQVGSI